MAKKKRGPKPCEGTGGEAVDAANEDSLSNSTVFAAVGNRVQSAAGNPHRNPLRNIRKKVAACEELKEKRENEGDGSLDQGQLKKVAGLKSLVREMVAVEKRWRAYERKARREWRQAMRRDAQKFAAWLLMGVLREHRRQEAILDFGYNLRHPLRCMCAEDVRRIMGFLPARGDKAFKIAPVPPPQPPHKEIALVLSILFAFCAAVSALLHFPVQAVLLETAESAVFAAAYYYQSSHVMQVAAHLVTFFTSLWLVWKGQSQDPLWQGCLRSFTGLAVVGLHYFSSLFVLLSSWIVLGFVPLAGQYLASVVVHTYLPLQSCYTLLLSVSHSIEPPNPPPKPISSWLPGPLTVWHSLPDFSGLPRALAASTNASLLTWGLLLFARAVLVTHPPLVGVLVLILFLLPKPDITAPVHDVPEKTDENNEEEGGEDAEDGDDVEVGVQALAFSSPQDAPASASSVVRIYLTMKQWLTGG